MLPELESAVLKSASSRTIAVDHTRHGAAGARKRYRGAASMGSRTHDIELGPGPAQKYTTKSAIAAFQEFSQQLLPLTQTVESLFQVPLPEEQEKYTAAYNAKFKIRGTNKRDPVDEAFAIWTSRSLVINANTNNHKDLQDVFHGWCAIVDWGTS